MLLWVEMIQQFWSRWRANNRLERGRGGCGSMKRSPQWPGHGVIGTSCGGVELLEGGQNEVVTMLLLDGMR